MNKPFCYSLDCFAYLSEIKGNIPRYIEAAEDTIVTKDNFLDINVVVL